MNFGGPNSQSLSRHKSSDFLEYDFYRVATAAAFCRATERAIDLAHPQTRHITTDGRPHLRLAQELQEQTIIRRSQLNTRINQGIVSQD